MENLNAELIKQKLPQPGREKGREKGSLLISISSDSFPALTLFPLSASPPSSGGREKGSLLISISSDSFPALTLFPLSASPPSSGGMRNPARRGTSATRRTGAARLPFEHGKPERGTY